MKTQYTKPSAAIVECYDPLMLDMYVSRKTTYEGEASRESKFGIEESDTEEHENFWDE